MVAWRREKYEPMGGPAGGNGGRGGNVYLVADANLTTLIDFRYRARFEAKSGTRGGPKTMHGPQGKDLIIKVPPGTVVRDLETGLIIADLVEPDQEVMVAEGGKGGRGNAQLASPTRRSPNFCEPGEPGISRSLELELKLLADVGIIGLPNAGKSSLLSIMTSAKPKIAAYPFSTLEPSLGVVQKPEGGGYVLAEIPGLVKGAATGIGLGHKFLKHIERTRLIVHLADISADQLESNILSVNEELRLFNDKLHLLPQILVLNKADLVDEREAKAIVQKLKSHKANFLPSTSLTTECDVLLISCATRKGIPQLQKAIFAALSHLPEKKFCHAVVFDDPKAQEHKDTGYQIQRKKNIFTVAGDRVERLVSVTNIKSPESLHHLFQTLRAMGVIDALIKEGMKPGSEIVLGKTSFVFGEEFH